MTEETGDPSAEPFTLLRLCCDSLESDLPYTRGTGGAVPLLPITTARGGAERFMEGARAIVIAVARASIAGSSIPIEPVDPRSPAGGFAWRDRGTLAFSRSACNSATVFCGFGGAIVHRGSMVDGAAPATWGIGVGVVLPPPCGGTTELRNPSKAVAEGSAEKSESDQLIKSRSSLLSDRRGGLTGVLGIGDIALVVSSSLVSSSLSVLITCWIANAGCGRAAEGETGSGFVVRRGGRERGPGGVTWLVQVGEFMDDVGDPSLSTWTTPDRTEPSKESARSRTEARGGGKNCG